jgi:hypothetical protein
MSPLRTFSALFGVIAACATHVCDASDQAAMATLNVEYRVQRDRVRVEFQDRQNFRFVASDGAQTIIKDGAIYLIVKQTGRPDSVILVSDRRTANSALDAPIKVSKTVALSAKERKNLAVYEKQGAPQLHRTSLQYRDKATSLVITSLKNATLASAQLAMRETLMEMDMTMCGATVQALVAAWVPELTRQGHAVLSTNTDIEISALPTQAQSANRMALPNGQPVQDYRLPSPNVPSTR